MYFIKDTRLLLIAKDTKLKENKAVKLVNMTSISFRTTEPFFLKDDYKWAQGIFLGWWNVLYHDGGGGYTMCKSSSHFILWWTVFYINYTSIKLTRQKKTDMSLVSFENSDNDLFGESVTKNTVLEIKIKTKPGSLEFLNDFHVCYLSWPLPHHPSKIETEVIIATFYPWEYWSSSEATSQKKELHPSDTGKLKPSFLVSSPSFYHMTSSLS